MKWPFVKRSTFESTVRDLEQYNDHAYESVSKYADARFRCSILEVELEKQQAKSEAAQKDVQQTLLDVLGAYVPVRWEPEYHRGYYVTSVCLGEHCKHPHQNGLYVFGDFSKFTREVMKRISSGWRPSEDYCRECTPFPVEETEDGKWRVTTVFCGYGGCDAQYQDFDSKPDAQAYAAELYDSGRRINWNGLCSECADEYYQSCI